MFSRLLKNIGTNPSAIEALSIYSNRLKKQQNARKLAILFLGAGLAMLMIMPLLNTDRSLKYSNEHIINGIQTSETIADEWDTNQLFRDIYTRFGIERKDITSISNDNLETIHAAPENRYWVSSININQPAENNPEIDKSLNFYVNDRLVHFAPLELWNENEYARTYQAYKARNSSTGDAFWILKDSGNLIQIGNTIADQTPIPPILEASKTVRHSDAPLNDGNLVDFVYEYRNTTEQSVSVNTEISDNVDLSKVTVLSSSPNVNIDTDGKISIYLGELEYRSWSTVSIIKLRINSQEFKNATSLCSNADLRSDNALISDSLIRTKNAVNDQECQNSELANSTPVLVGRYSLVKNVSKNTDYQYKSVDAEAGDVLEYKIVTTNTSDQNLINATVSNNVSDLLDYADVDVNFLIPRGGRFEPAIQNVLWENQKLLANKDSERFFRVIVKDNIPSTNRPSNISLNYDCKLSNTFGNLTVVNLNCPILKSYEEIPAASRKSTVLFTSILFLSFLFFYKRNDLIVKEVQAIKKTNGQKRSR